MVKTEFDIILPVHGGLDFTIKCIKHLYANTQHPFHLIVVDDTDASLEHGAFHPISPTDVTSDYLNRLAKLQENVTYINHDKPFRCGNEFFNLAFEHCKHDIVATVMNSTMVEPYWDDSGLRIMKEDPKVGVIGFKNLQPDFKIESAGIPFMGLTPIDYGKGLPADQLTVIKEYPSVQWAFAMLRLEAVKGILDTTNYYGFVGWDDIDNCFEARKHGWKVVYCGLGAGVHYTRATRGNDSPDHFRFNKKNQETFYKKWNKDYGFWNKYMEGNKLDVTFKLSEETRGILKNAVITAQVINKLLTEQNSKLQVLAKNALEEVKVDPTMYVITVDPLTDAFTIKLRTNEPDKLPNVEGSPEVVPVELPDAVNVLKKDGLQDLPKVVAVVPGGDGECEKEVKV